MSVCMSVCLAARPYVISQKQFHNATYFLEIETRSSNQTVHYRVHKSSSLGPVLEPDKSSSHHPILFLEDLFS
jgi:hypothetical protein